jgi:hypothetical protein
MPNRTLFDDSASSDTGGLFISPSQTGPLAQSFNSGADPIALSDIKLVLEDSTASDGGTITIELCSDTGSGPGSVVATLGTIADSMLSASAATYDVPIGTSPTLSANTTYWIELTSGAGSNAQWEGSLGATGTGVSGQQAYDQGAENSSFDFLMTLTGSLCFAAGTRILTLRGEVPVENLQPGNLAVAVRAGRLAPIVWVGRRHVNLTAHPNPQNINPVRVHAHAFGPGRPHTDLILSPNHSLCIDGALIPIRYLLNGATIVQEAWESVDYYHVELDAHDILLANGLSAESYLDVGNRAAFANGGGTLALHPDFAETTLAANACAPLFDKAEPLTRLRKFLRDRAEALGHIRTTDAALRVYANGGIILPVSQPGGLRFDLPHGTETIRLVSRSARPSDLRAEPADGRILGVGITSLALDGHTLPLDHPRLTQGWHAAEPTLRWTNGDAVLDTHGALTLTLCLHPGMTYWAEPDVQLKTARSGRASG